MTPAIFCPNNHLILSANRCDICAWERPRLGKPGTPAWGPLSLGTELGGSGKSLALRPAVVEHTAVFQVSGGEVLQGVDLSTGNPLWREVLEPGHRVRGMTVVDKRVLVSICDERSDLDQSGSGWLGRMEPLIGQIEQVWTAGNHMIGRPVVTEDRLIVRTGTPELVVFNLRRLPEICWRAPLQAWWAVAEPVAAGGVILISDGEAMLGQGELVGYDLASGEIVWRQPTEGMLPSAPRVVGNTILCQERKSLVARSLQDGKQIWQRSFKQIYTSVETSAGLAYAIVRGSQDPDAPDHYLLRCLDPVNGKDVWQAGVPGRAHQLLLADPDVVLVGLDHGCILAYDAKDGQSSWEYTLGGEEDPLRLQLSQVNGMVLAGTWSGMAVALRLAAPSEAPGDAGELYRNEQWVEAADTFALQGDLVRAGEIYEQKLKDEDDSNHLQKAYLLYEKGGALQQAAELATKSGWLEQAWTCFKRLGDLDGQARVLEMKADYLGAALLYEKLGNLLKAAQCYENGGNYATAYELYLRLEVTDPIERLLPNLPQLEAAKYWERVGQYSQAAELAYHAGSLEYAVKLFEQEGAVDREIEVLQQLVTRHADLWAVERLAKLAREQGRFALEAQTWEQLCRSTADEDLEEKYIRRTADAYFEAALQAREAGKRSSEIAKLYESALLWYGRCIQPDAREKMNVCRRAILYLRKQPYVMVQGKGGEVFEEEVMNTLNLMVENEGFGEALGVCFSVNSTLFDLISEDCDVFDLLPNEKKEWQLSLRPRARQIGFVRLVLTWKWHDRKGVTYTERSILDHVKVKAHGESTGDARPPVINNNYGNVYQVDGDMVGGAKVEGDQFTGDKVAAGGRKGDQINLNRGVAANLPVEETQSTQSCPECGRINSPENKYCQACGRPLAGG